MIQIFTALTLCVHYAVDVIAAVPFAIACWTLADRLIRCSPLPTEIPLAPTPTHTPALVTALVVSLLALLLWAQLAPLPPNLAWPLILLITALPTYLTLRPHDRRPPPATRH